MRVFSALYGTLLRPLALALAANRERSALQRAKSQGQADAETRADGLRGTYPSTTQIRFCLPTPVLERSAQDVGDGAVAFFHEVEGPAVGCEIHLLIVQAHQAENRRLQIADVMRILHGLVANLVGRALDHTTPHAGAGQKGAESDRKSTRLNSSHSRASRMPSSA